MGKPRELWLHFCDELSDDFTKKTSSVELRHQLALSELNEIFGRMGYTNADMNLPMPASFDKSVFEKRDVARELAWDNAKEKELATVLVDQLYLAQRAAYDAIMLSVTTQTPALFFIDGPGGTGKTFLYETVLHSVRSEPGRIALACAWSGIAAILLEGGRTCHSRFGLPVPMPREEVTSSISAQSSRAEVLRRASVIIWDEAPMAPCEALEAVDMLLQQLMANALPFGGKVVVLGGDFRQVLPVMPHCSRDEVVL